MSLSFTLGVKLTGHGNKVLFYFDKPCVVWTFSPVLPSGDSKFDHASH